MAAACNEMEADLLGEGDGESPLGRRGGVSLLVDIVLQKAYTDLTILSEM